MQSALQQCRSCCHSALRTRELKSIQASRAAADAYTKVQGRWRGLCDTGSGLQSAITAAACLSRYGLAVGHLLQLALWLLLLLARLFCAAVLNRVVQSRNHIACIA